MNKALLFRAGSGAVSVPNPSAFRGLSALTLEFYFTLLDYADGCIIDYHAANLGYAVYWNHTQETLAAYVGNGTTFIFPFFNTTLTLDVRYHIALVWDGSNIYVYINGVKESNSGALSGGNTGNPAKAFYIGNNSGVNGGAISVVDEIRLSNNARYAATFTPPSGKLISDANTIEIFHLDEGKGILTTGVNGNIGTLSGSPLPLWVGGAAITPPQGSGVNIVKVGSSDLNFGQEVSDQSLPVVIASDQPAISLALANAVAPSLAEGKQVLLSTDLEGNLRIILGTQIAGEDLTNNKLRVELNYSNFNIITAATTTVKTGAGYVDEIIIAGGTLGNVTIYDNTEGSGTVLCPTVTPLSGAIILKHCNFSIGLTIVTAAATAITGSYR